MWFVIWRFFIGFWMVLKLQAQWVDFCASAGSTSTSAASGNKSSGMGTCLRHDVGFVLKMFFSGFAQLLFMVSTWVELPQETIKTNKNQARKCASLVHPLEVNLGALGLLPSSEGHKSARRCRLVFSIWTPGAGNRGTRDFYEKNLRKSGWTLSERSMKTAVWLSKKLLF